MRGDIVLELGNALIQPPFVVAFIYILTDQWRFSKKTAINVLCIMLVILMAVDLIIYGPASDLRAAKDMVVMASVPIMVGIVLFLSGYRGGRTWFIIFSALSFNLMSVLAGEIVCGRRDINRFLIKIFISAIMLLLVYQYLRKPCQEMLSQIQRGWHRLALIPFFSGVLSIVVLLSGKMHNEPNMMLAAIAVCVITACFYLVLYHNFVQLHEQFKTKAAYHMMEAQMASFQERAASMEEVNRQMAIFRHDMRHFIQIQKIFLENGDVQGAGKILASMDENIKDMSVMVKHYTGNFILDSVLSNYEKRAREGGIDFDVHMELPAQLQTDPLALAVVLANGLENAYHACLEIPEGGQRIIRLRGTKEKNQFFLEISNSISGEVAFDPKTERPVAQRPEHGYGTQSIQAFAARYQAYVDYKTEDGWFKLRIILDLKRIN